MTASEVAVGASVEVTVDRMAAGGDGLGRLADGRVAFVHGALPGERVVADVTTTKRDYVKARTVSVLQPTDERRSPPCPMVAAGCGGCGWQHLHADAQHRWKLAVVRDALLRTARLPDADVRLGARMPEWGYRTTMRLAVGRDGRLGLRGQQSHRVVVLDHCPVAHPTLDELIGRVRAPGADEVRARVSVATGAGNVRAIGRGRPRWSGLGVHVHHGPAASLVERVAGVDLRVSIGSFFQSGPAAASALVAEVGAAIADLAGEPLLDAYGGVGLFAATVATGDVTLVESSSSACADARVNLPTGTVIESVFEAWQPVAHPVVIADPARAGLGREGAAVAAAATGARLVLVSCDPVAAARDIGLLIEHGLTHRHSTVLDLFPNTPHVEVVSVLDRA